MGYICVSHHLKKVEFTASLIGRVMDNSYQFYGLVRRKYILMILPLALLLLLVARVLISSIPSDYYLHLDDPIIILKELGILLAMIMALFIDKIAVKYSEEQWNISFNNKVIEISSNKRARMVFALTQLSKVELIKARRIKSKMIGIGFLFKDMENKKKVMDVCVTLQPTSLSGVKEKSNLAIFQQFLDTFNKQVLVPQFQLKQCFFSTPSGQGYFRK